MLPSFSGRVSVTKNGRPIWCFRYDGVAYFIPLDRWDGNIKWIGPKNERPEMLGMQEEEGTDNPWHLLEVPPKVG